MLRGVATIVLLLLNLILWGTPILLGGIIKFLMPGRKRVPVVNFLVGLAENWVEGNNRIFDTMLSTKWDVSGVETDGYDGHYLIVANHISWVDIFVLFRAFHHRTAFIRFFLKQQLIWFPIAGQGCWALDFPFMKRYTPEFLAAHPEKRGEDLATTRTACRKYRKVPVAIANFLEGTRFTREKHDDQDSPYRHLLRPRIGGIAFVLASMGDLLDATFDVTLAYPHGDVSFWQFVTNRVPRIVVRARRVEIPDDFYDEAVTRPGPVRDRFKEWVDQLWREKDALIDDMVDELTSA
ncbi:MAG TPA: acyltransferase [Thermoanaerobaculia bacterium]|nr:acyltransferase [Thermoanaerobaculia bacterium]